MKPLYAFLSILSITLIFIIVAYVSELKQEIKDTKNILQEIEESEKNLDRDNDNDGLSFREEQKLGTSDDNIDFDKDGVPDNLDLHPIGGGRYLFKLFEWQYNNQTLKINASIHEDYYDYKKNLLRTRNRTEYVDIYDPMIQQIKTQLIQYMKDLNLRCKSCFAIPFIRSLPYVDDINTGFDEYPKYPIETLMEGNGDCEDMAYLGSSIIHAMGVDVILVNYPGHMAIAVWYPDCPGHFFNYSNKIYCYLETAGTDWGLGDIAQKWKDQKAIIIDI